MRSRFYDCSLFDTKNVLNFLRFEYSNTQRRSFRIRVLKRVVNFVARLGGSLASTRILYRSNNRNAVLVANLDISFVDAAPVSPRLFRRRTKIN